jgi:hypothetical protein
MSFSVFSVPLFLAEREGFPSACFWKHLHGVIVFEKPKGLMNEKREVTTWRRFCRNAERR